jgi:hypothetical protein
MNEPSILSILTLEKSTECAGIDERTARQHTIIFYLFVFKSYAERATSSNDRKQMTGNKEEKMVPGVGVELRPGIENA